jgi:POLQ-like helicase
LRLKSPVSNGLGGEVEAVFEHDDRSVFNEDNGQITSIEIILSGTCNSLFIEAKLVERGFVGCSVFAGGDCEGRKPYPEMLGDCYLHHIGRRYWQRLNKLGFSEVTLVD